MASLAFNSLLDRWKHRLLSFYGTRELLDHYLRASQNYADFVLTAAQMDTLNATAVTVLAAPGSGLVNLIEGIFLKVNSTGFTVFELGSGVLEFRYTDASGAKVVTDVTNAVVESTTDVMDWCPGIVCAPVANALICAHASADVTTGTGNVQGRIYYRTVKVSEIV